MKTKLLLFFSLFLFSYFSEAQDFTDSNLPIVIITTDNDPNTGQPIGIPDEPKVLGIMKIIFHPDGSRNYLTDQNNPNYLDYNGRIGIEIRGSTSQLLPKKGYGFTTLQADNVSNNNVSLLGMPQENDWVLNGLAYDPSLIRDFLSYDLANEMGNYAPRTVFCEVVINGEYVGLYLLMEKIKVDQNRVDVVKMTTLDNTNPSYTGGYITKSDKTTESDPVAWTMPSYYGTVDFIHVSPKPEDITAQQDMYIENQFNSFRNNMTVQNESITTGYPAKIDIPSFVDFMLISELASNVDSYQYSTYFHKDRNGKLRAGPIWDFNLTYGNDLFSFGFDRSHTNVWQFDNYDNTGATFWKDLYDNETFKCYLSKRWVEITSTGEPFDYNMISTKIDAAVSLITEAAAREELRWGTVGNWEYSIDDLKYWLEERIVWLNGNLSDYQSCANPTLPSLVISKINYHPAENLGYESKDLEFFEITNNSDVNVSLAGYYFRELGFSYSFAPNAVIAANQKIFLASNASIFEEFYGFTAFGEYSRELSNNSEKIILADAFGNIVDFVEYSDSAPWDTQADGQGFYLQLLNMDLDNSLYSSWYATSQAINIENISPENSVVVFPNPAHQFITIQSNNIPVRSFEIYDLMGRIVMQQQDFNSIKNSISIENLPLGTYIIQLFFDNGNSSIKKFMKM